MNRIPVRPEYREAFEEAFRQRARLVDRAPGFLRNLVLRPKNPEDPYIVLTFWENEAAFLAWTESPAFRQGHARHTLPKEAFLGPNRLESYTVFWTPRRAECPAVAFPQKGTEESDTTPMLACASMGPWQKVPGEVTTNIPRSSPHALGFSGERPTRPEGLRPGPTGPFTSSSGCA
jgi:heme-degrading monooxygenase HmoA